MTTPERDRYTISLRIRAPKALTEALERAAQASLTTEWNTSDKQSSLV